MNLLITIMFLGMGIASPQALFGILVGLSICFLMSNKSTQTNMINKFTTWSWYDWRV